MTYRGTAPLSTTEIRMVEERRFPDARNNSVEAVNVILAVDCSRNSIPCPGHRCSSSSTVHRLSRPIRAISDLTRPGRSPSPSLSLRLVNAAPTRPKDIDFQPSQPWLSSASFSRRWLSDAEISLRAAEFPSLYIFLFSRTGARSRPVARASAPLPPSPEPASPAMISPCRIPPSFFYTVLPFTRHAFRKTTLSAIWSIIVTLAFTVKIVRTVRNRFFVRSIPSIYTVGLLNYEIDKGTTWFLRYYRQLWIQSFIYLN